MAYVSLYRKYRPQVMTAPPDGALDSVLATLPTPTPYWPRGRFSATWQKQPFAEKLLISGTMGT